MEDDPTFYEMLIQQSADSRVERFVWQPGDLVRRDNEEDEEEERDYWESYWDQTR
jgi:hypothetical protein